MLCLATAWLQQALLLVDEVNYSDIVMTTSLYLQGIPSPVVAALMEEAVSICTRTLHNLAVSLSRFVKLNNLSSAVNHASKNASSQHRILKYSRHFTPLAQESPQQSFNLSSLYHSLK